MSRFTYMVYASLMLCVVFLLPGCASVERNTNDIAQLKNQMANIESVVARQNLIIQQNQGELEALADRSDALVSSIQTVQSSQPVEQSFTAPSYPTLAAPSATAPSAVKTSGTSVISDKFSSPPSVRELQLSLRNAGFYTGSIDGKVGPMTQSAIKQFQKANGLGSDGVVGKKTWAKLKTYL